MSDKLIDRSNAPPAENEIYKVIELHGKRFEIRYGYYEEVDRDYEPMPIYPNFRKEPLYTDEGTPFVTMMQDACTYYKGEKKRTADSTCDECKYFERGEDWFGTCKCPHNRERKNE